MFRNLFVSAAGHRDPSIPEGHRVYAIGDVHGCDDLLAALLAKVETDCAARPEASNVIVFLGDLIDRGSDSAGVVERLRTYHHASIRTVFIMGNHEEVLLRILAGEAELVGDWLRFGGAECLLSYDVDPDDLGRMGPDQAVEAIRAAIPASHAEFLGSFADTFRAGDYLFVHAGLRPGVPLGEQTQQDLRWIRQPFLDDRGDSGMVVVHGHTISEHVEEWPNRIGIDTGAYRSGVLTAIGIQNKERWFLQTGESSDIGGVSPGAADSQG